ncbi:MAG: BatD family protein [Dokdonella sp.]
MTPIAIRLSVACAWVALAGATLFAHAATPDARAWLDRTTMQMGETVTLNVQTSEVGSAQPDFAALAQDFNLLNTQSSQQVSIVNGARSATMLWAIGLEPKHAGHITIAPISVGGARTAAISLDVLAASAQASTKPGDDVFIEVSADPRTPYVQQQVRYTLKLYSALDITSGSLGEPHADGVGVRRLGQTAQDQPYLATLGGRQYHVIERHYALTPERSGNIDLGAIAFRGTALDGSDPSGFFSHGRTIAARSNAIQLEVKPKPAQWSGGAWLPAASLTLKDETALPDEVHVGDPVTRTIRMQAQGLSFEQLPELVLAAPPGAQMYPDKSDTRTRDDGEWLWGERVRKFAFVPDRTGTLTIPGVQVAWWDSVHDHAEIAQLPSQTIHVLPAMGAAATAPAASAPAMGETAQRTSGSSAPNASVLLPVAFWTVDVRHLRLWRALAIIGFVLWIATLGAWRWRSRRGVRAGLAAAPRVPDSSAHRAVFLRACSLGDFSGAERALVAWARNERPRVRNLGELATCLVDTSQCDSLRDLQRARYAGGSSQGLAMRLQQAFRRGLAWRDQAAPPAVPSSLPALYPERD